MGIMKTVVEMGRSITGVDYLGKIGMPDVPATYKGELPKNRFGRFVDRFDAASIAFTKQLFRSGITAGSDYINVGKDGVTIKKNSLSKLKDKVVDVLF